jgi:uncharacterized membrane-anchored protein YitT (DUF2179 family)
MVQELSEKHPIVDYIFITLGSAIMAFGIAVFLVDAYVVPGGVTGLSQAVYYMTDGALPVGLLMWIFNIPLFFWGIKELGKTFGVRTFYAFTTNSIFTDLFRDGYGGFGLHLHKMESITYILEHDFFFHIFLGAVFLGLGLGIIFKFKGTTAGSDIVASILNKYFGTKPGTGIIMIDFFVITFASIAIYFNESTPTPVLALAFYAMFLLYLSSKLIDMVIDGIDYAKAAYIISDKYEEISNAIMNKMSRGATAIKTRGIYRNIEREVIMTVVTNKEVPQLTDTIKEIDPDAFMIINNVHEVVGRGFRRRF